MKPIPNLKSKFLETVDELEENVLPEGVDEYEVELHISDIEQEMDDILNTELLWKWKISRKKIYKKYLFLQGIRSYTVFTDICNSIHVWNVLKYHKF